MLYLEELLNIMPAPKEPEEAGNVLAWRVLEVKLGIKLPDDYKAFINHYGSGLICDDLWVYNPFSKSKGLNLGATENILAMYRVIRDGHPKEFNYPLYPEKQGLLPCAASEQSWYLMWHTVGEANEWPLVLMDFVDMSKRELPYSLVEFIIKFLKNELEIVKTNHPCKVNFLPKSQIQHGKES